MQDNYIKGKRECLKHLTEDEKIARAKQQNKEACKRRDERKKAKALGLEGPPLRATKPADDQERKERHAASERRRRANWRDADPDGYSQYERNRKEPHRETLSEKRRQRYRDNKADHIRKVMEWQKNNPDKVRSYSRKTLERRAKRELDDQTLKQARADKRRENERRRLIEDPHYRTAKNLRSSLRQALRLYGDGRKTTSVVNLVGCSMSELVAHIESLWEPWMSWSNYGKPKSGSPGWVIDHIRPCCSFDLVEIEEQRLCYHHSNLQPLEYYTNIRKSGRLDWVKPH